MSGPLQVFLFAPLAILAVVFVLIALWACMQLAAEVRDCMYWRRRRREYQRQQAREREAR